ncbi:MAG: YciI family protein [Solirubrobacteraceae bacterium]
MTQYLLAVQGVDYAAIPPQDQMERTYGAVDAFNEEVKAAGAWVFAGGLEAPETATVVRIENGESVLTDGPYTESKEHLGGFWVIEAADLDAALVWAEKGSRACANPVEVRPFQGEPEA